MKKISLRQWVNLIAILLTILINGMANTLPINNLTTGEISDRFEVFFVPAGYVFSIWGLIYIGLVAFGIFQLLPAQRHNERLQRIGYLPSVAAVANIAWLLLWHYEYFTLTIFAMLGLLVTLILIYLRLDIGRKPVTRAELWFTNLPFSIYLGWITVATIANVTSLLDYLNWSGWGISDEIWTVIMLITAVIIATLMTITRGDVAYLLVLVWAFVGIAVKHTGTPVVSNTAWAAAAILAVMALVALIMNRAVYKVSTRKE